MFCGVTYNILTPTWSRVELVYAFKTMVAEHFSVYEHLPNREQNTEVAYVHAPKLWATGASAIE